MPSNTIRFLSIGCSALFAAYVALFITAVFFATVKTERSGLVRELESEVAALETAYFNAISELSAADVVSQGYVTPISVSYVGNNTGPAVTRAGEQD